MHCQLAGPCQLNLWKQDFCSEIKPTKLCQFQFGQCLYWSYTLQQPFKMRVDFSNQALTVAVMTYFEVLYLSAEL
jgi:hypothetical protein